MLAESLGSVLKVRYEARRVEAVRILAAVTLGVLITQTATVLTEARGEEPTPITHMGGMFRATAALLAAAAAVPEGITAAAAATELMGANLVIPEAFRVQAVAAVEAGPRAHLEPPVAAAVRVSLGGLTQVVAALPALAVAVEVRVGAQEVYPAVALMAVAVAVAEVLGPAVLFVSSGPAALVFPANSPPLIRATSRK